MQAKFDSGREVELRFRGEHGMKTLLLRFPEDNDWFEHSRKRRIVSKKVGRGQETTVDSERADVDLINKVQVGEQQFDAAEATYAAGELAKAEIVEVRHGDNAAEVTLRVLGGVETKHTIRYPSKAAVMQYRRQAGRLIDMPHGTQHMTIFLEPSAEMYDRYVESNEGYVAAVPAIHKSAAFSAALETPEENKDEDF